MAISLVCLQMVCQRGPLAPPPRSGRKKHFPAITFSSDHINLRPGLARELLEFRRLFRMPPTTANDDAFGHDLAIADQVLADDVNVVELAFLNRDEGGVSCTPPLHAPEFATPHRHRRIHR